MPRPLSPRRPSRPRGSRLAPSRERVELAEEPSHGEATWTSSYDIDPAGIPAAEKVALLEDWSGRLMASAGVDHVTANVLAVVEDKHYADLAGTVTTQRRVRVHPVVEAVAVNAAAGGFESMRSLAPPAGRGWEYLLGEGWDWDDELARIPDYLAEKLHAPSVTPGVHDLVIDPTNLWLTIHESIGHATELDRAMGYEAAYAGTSFATFDKLGTLRYGSEIMNVTGDRTVPHGLATVGYDDEGVEAQTFDLVRDGVLHRLPARPAHRAPRGPRPFQRLCLRRLLEPHAHPAHGERVAAACAGRRSDDRGAHLGRRPWLLHIVGDKSWSIDMQRYNFQFTGQRFFRIEKGRLAGQVRDLAYQSRTTDFWGAMEAVGGESTYLLGGAFNCGKGQPGQVAPVSHGCPSALFRGINVLNTRAESGR